MSTSADARAEIGLYDSTVPSDRRTAVPAGARERVRRLVDAPWFHRFIIAVIIMNAADLGVEASLAPGDPQMGLVSGLDTAAIAIFVAELALKMFAYRTAFFRDGWNWFDLVVVGSAVVPVAQIFSVLRVLRILRVLRLVSAVPSMRRVVVALLGAIPGLLSILGLVVVVLYTGAVIGVRMFSDVPEYFGSIGRALYTMFTLLTVEDWPDISDEVLARHPKAWIFFVVYIVICAFVMLNLLIGVIVSTMEHNLNAERWEEDQRLEEEQHNELMAELRGLREQVEELRSERRIS